MSRKKFRGTLLAVSLLAFGAMTFSVVGLTSCQQNEVEEEDPVLEGVTAVSITNKEELSADGWYALTAQRMIELSFTGSQINPQEAIYNGSLVVTSSNTNVVSIQGLYIAPAGEGTATVTVTAKTDSGEVSDSVEVTVLQALTEPDPTEITVSDLLAYDYDGYMATLPQPVFTVTGVVGEWYNDTVPTKYGNFYLHDLEDDSKRIIVYGSTLTEGSLVFNNGTWAFNNPKDFLDADGNPTAKKGDTVTMKVLLDNYNGTNQIQGEFLNIEEGVTIDYESITISADKTTLDINDHATLTNTFTPENVNVGDITYEVTSGEDVVEIVDNELVYARKAGSATIVGKGGSVTSEPITITVTENEITYNTIESIYDKVGEDVAFYGKFLGSYAASQNYGIFVGDGDYAVFIYRGEAPEGVEVGDGLKVTGSTSVYNGGFQVSDADILVDDKTRGSEPTTLEITTLDGIDGKDTGRKVKVTGTVSEVALDSYSNVTLKVTTAEGAVVDVKADSRYVSEENCNALAALTDGATATIEGFVTFNVSKLNTLPTDATGLQIVNPSVVE